MKNIKYILFGFLFLGLASSCNDYLDVNENPNYPYETDVPPHVLLPPMIQQMGSGIQFDSRFIGRYTQNWADPGAGNVWDRHGYNVGSDAGGEIWRVHYWAIGKNVQVMIDTAKSSGKNIYAGIGYAIQAWSWQTLTDYHGDAILDEAFQEKTSYAFDSQEKVYAHVLKMCDSALIFLNLPSVTDRNLAAADQFYRGDAAKWRRFVWGVRARNLAHLTAKSTYDPNAVIAACDSSMKIASDNALVPFESTVSTNANFYGTLRQNMLSFRISGFVSGLMNGTNIGSSGVRDPRSASMFSIAATDSIVRGGEPGNGVATNVLNMWGTTTGFPAAGNRGRYIFADNAPFPIMTSFELSFIRAEANFRKGDKTNALVDYKRAIDQHVDFINTYATLNPATTPLIAAATKTAMLANTKIVPTSKDSLTMRSILNQKYIADWGWNHVETWTDIRRFQYNRGQYDGLQIYNLVIPIILFNENGGKVAYRVRPRYNSEYVWNRENLGKIGALDADYHTKPMWFMQP
jgi:Starch-binding associating with outer membrane